MHNGWIRIHRKILQSEMYKYLSSKQRDVMWQCLLLANHRPKEWIFEGELYRCEPGEFVTSLKNLKDYCAKDVSIQNIRTALLILEKWQFLTYRSTKKCRVVTLVNWAIYQPCQQSDQQSDQQTANKQLTTNKNIKNDNNIKNNIYMSKNSSSVDEIYNAYPSKCPIQNRSLGKSSKDKLKIEKLLRLESKEKLLETIRLYIADCEKNNSYVKNFSTFLNNLPDIEALKASGVSQGGSELKPTKFERY